MSDNTSAILQEAFESIEEGNLARAREILEPLSESESNNPAYWWVYSHALENEDDGRKALNRVVELDPTYPGATELKNTLVTPSSTAGVDDIEEWDENSFTVEKSESQPASGGGRGIAKIVLVGCIAAIVAGILFALTNGLGGDAAVTPTAVADNTQIPQAQVQTNITATDIATEPTIAVAGTETTEAEEIVNSTSTEVIAPTDSPTIVATELPTEASTFVPEYISRLTSDLTDFDISDEDISIQQTLLGETLTVAVCAQLGAESSIRLNETMDSFISSYSLIPDSIEAVAVTLTNCDDDSISRTIGVTRDTLQSVANDEIEIKDFQRLWQPLS